MQTFVGGQKELTLMILSRNNGKVTKVRQNEHIFVNSSLEDLVSSIPTQKYSSFAEKCKFL